MNVKTQTNLCALLAEEWLTSGWIAHTLHHATIQVAEHTQRVNAVERQVPAAFDFSSKAESYPYIVSQMTAVSQHERDWKTGENCKPKDDAPQSYEILSSLPRYNIKDCSPALAQK